MRVQELEARVSDVRDDGYIVVGGSRSYYVPMKEGWSLKEDDKLHIVLLANKEGHVFLAGARVGKRVYYSNEKDYSQHGITKRDIRRAIKVLYGRKK